MEYTRLGNTGLKVSRLALGCMSYGDPTTPGAHQWALTDDEAQPFFRQAVELGITFWDTANVYQARHLRGGRRPRDHALLAPRGHRAGHQGARQDARRPRRSRACRARRSSSRSTPR